jgi:hypothetical protein
LVIDQDKQNVWPICLAELLFGMKDIEVQYPDCTEQNSEQTLALRFHNQLETQLGSSPQSKRCAALL